VRQTALHVACERGELEVVRFLIARGAGPRTKDGLGRMPSKRTDMAKPGAADLLKALEGRVTKGQGGTGGPAGWLVRLLGR
jgi:hypothetical protein